MLPSVEPLTAWAKNCTEVGAGAEVVTDAASAPPTACAESCKEENCEEAVADAASSMFIALIS